MIYMSPSWWQWNVAEAIKDIIEPFLSYLRKLTKIIPHDRYFKYSMWIKGHHFIITILKELLKHHNTYVLVQEMLHQHYIWLREVLVEKNQECGKIAYHAKAFLHVRQYHTAHINLACAVTTPNDSIPFVTQVGRSRAIFLFN